jgi:Ca2+-dependent lipid-binding protein
MELLMKDPVDRVHTSPFKKEMNRHTKNPRALRAFVEGQKNIVLQEIEKQKEMTFDKAYGELETASNTQESLLSLNQRNKQIHSLQQQESTRRQKEIKHVNEDKQLAKRKYEMNQWSVENKKETLFLYSMFFILIAGIVFLAAFMHMGFIHSHVFTALIVPFIIIFILVVIYRARLTTYYRNKRYWNRRTFKGDDSWKIRIPSICSEPPTLSTECPITCD